LFSWWTGVPYSRAALALVAGESSDGLSSNFMRADQGMGPLWGEYYAVIVIATCGFIFAASAGYFLCFWPGKRPSAKVLLTVFLPSVTSLLLIAIKFLRIRSGSYSVLSRIRGTNVSWAARELWNIGTGMHYSVLALALIGLFLARLAFGRSTLPLSIAGPSSGDDESPVAWDGCKRALWFFLAAGNFVVLLASSFLYVGWSRALGVWQRQPALWMGFLGQFLFGAAMLGMTLWLVRTENRISIRRLLRFPGSRAMFIGLSLPVIVAVAPGVALFVLDRLDWAARGFGQFAPPQFGSYLPVPEVWTLSLILAAFAEEVIFRGVLQQHFVDRYGTWRGIFLVGVA
jgi:membrane protease YdiL (CAAX protease family)